MHLLTILMWFAVFQELPEEVVIPAWFEQLVGDKIFHAIMTVIASTKLIRSFLGNVKGYWALGLVALVSIAVGEFTFISEYGWLKSGLIGLGAGFFSAGGFRLAKLVGKKVIKQNLE